MLGLVTFMTVVFFGTMTFGGSALAGSCSEGLGLSESWIDRSLDFVSPPRAQRLEGILRDVNSQFRKRNWSPLVEAEVSVIQSIYSFTGGRFAVGPFLDEISSRSQVLKRLEWHQQFVDRLKDQKFLLNDVFQLEGLVELKPIWDHLAKRGWKIRFIKSRLSPLSRRGPVGADLGAKVLSVPISLRPTPVPMMLAANIFFVQLNEDLSDHPEVSSTLRSLLFDLVGQTSSQSRADEDLGYGWFLDGQKRMMKELMHFLLARESVMRSLQIYRRLVSVHPEFKVRTWDFLSKLNPVEIDSVLAYERRGISEEPAWADADHAERVRARLLLVNEMGFFRQFVFRSDRLEGVRSISFPRLVSLTAD